LPSSKSQVDADVRAARRRTLRRAAE
jgi:hypothetical protein